MTNHNFQFVVLQCCCDLKISSRSLELVWASKPGKLQGCRRWLVRWTPNNYTLRLIFRWTPNNYTLHMIFHLSDRIKTKGETAQSLLHQITFPLSAASRQKLIKYGPLSTEMQDKKLQNHSIWGEWALTFKQENAQTQVMNASEPNGPFLMSKVMAGHTTESEAGASKKNKCSDSIIQAIAYTPKPHFWSQWPHLMDAPLERSIRTVPKTQRSQLQVQGKRHLSHNSSDPQQLHNNEALRPHGGY